MVVEDGLVISIDALRRGGLIIPNAKSTFTKRWMNGTSNRCRAEVWFVIETHGTFGTMRLRFQVPNPMADGYETVEQSVQLLTRPQPFGGHRWFARCPTTGASCAKLYKPKGANRFAARKAWNGLSYRVQRLSAHRRVLRRAYKLRQRMGDVDGKIGDPIAKPKWMRCQTYQRKMIEITKIDYRAVCYLADALDLLKRKS
ncbi:MAG: hypothetical protein ACXIVD_01170 [Salinarimonas sp.]